MGRIRIMIIFAGAAFLVSALLDSSSQPDGNGIDIDSLLTMGFLVYIWYTLRWAVSSKKRKTPPAKPQNHGQYQNKVDSDAVDENPLPGVDRPDIVNIRKQVDPQEQTPPVPEGSSINLEKKPTPEPERPQAKRPAEEPWRPNVPRPYSGDTVPNILGALRREAVTVIHHKSPWSIIERGDTVGRFRNAPIPAWILTSDNRTADYNGIADSPAADETVCVEIPERSELILPPGLVYLLRS